jgi:plastocyanin domain-containing protein
MVRHLFRSLAGFIVLAPLLAACSRSDAAAAQPEKTAATASQIAIAVTADGFTPSSSHIPVGKPVTLVVTRKVAKTCATDLVIKEYGINQPLPENQPVTVTFTPTKPGPIHYSCAMDMVSGDLVAE